MIIAKECMMNYTEEEIKCYVGGVKVLRGKKVLVTGSEGMIGKELVRLLDDLGCEVFTADLKLGHDLRDYKECLRITEGIDYVFHLVGVKGSPTMTESRPVDFMAPMLQCDSNMIIASQKNKVKGFLYTSSIAVENSGTDRFPAWAKLTGEMLCEAMNLQYGKK